MRHRRCGGSINRLHVDPLGRLAIISSGFCPLGDVENDLRQTRTSPLARLIEASEIGAKEQEALIDALRTANAAIAKSPTIGTLANAVDKAFKAVSGPAFEMDVGLGLAEPSFHVIVRALRICLQMSPLRTSTRPTTASV